MSISKRFFVSHTLTPKRRERKTRCAARLRAGFVCKTSHHCCPAVSRTAMNSTKFAELFQFAQAVII
jgi:hypothetical protein